MVVELKYGLKTAGCQDCRSGVKGISAFPVGADSHCECGCFDIYMVGAHFLCDYFVQREYKSDKSASDITNGYFQAVDRGKNGAIYRSRSTSQIVPSHRFDK